MRRLFLTAILALSVLLQPIRAQQVAVSLTARPLVQFVPGTVILTLRITPDAHNRVFCVSYESEDGQSGQLCQDMQGLDEPRTRELPELKDLPGGLYRAQATVLRDDRTAIQSGIAEWRVIDSRTEGI